MSEINLAAFKAAIVTRFPELAHGQFALLTTGWQSVAVDVDNRLIFKFPRDDGAERALRIEAGFLAAVRPTVTMPVPDLVLIDGPPLFSRHAKLNGEHLVASDYARLPDQARQRLAEKMALFYAELHALDGGTMTEAGAKPIRPWLQPKDILERVWPVLSPELRLRAERTIASWQRLTSDPYGTTYGFFDGHGWNMAFDHHNHELNGIYDFADSGFGALHQDFIYSNFISPDLTARIVAEYESLTKRPLDRERIHFLTGAHRLSELAELADQPDHVPAMLKHFVEWAER